MYEKLAEYYDKFMSDVPYEEWVDYAESFLPKGGSGRDVGCGTGKFTVALKKSGFSVSGSDVSGEMLAAAASAARAEGENVTFIRQSAEQLCGHKPLDFVTAMCDVVNYMKNPAVFFKRAYAALKNGGVLFFDISSEYKLKNILAGNTFVYGDESVSLLWENFSAAGGRRVDMRLTFFERRENNYYSKSVEEQSQYVHTEQFIRERLSSAGFTGVKAYGFLKKRRPSEREERIHFLAYKKE